jgi:hypothetical protein
MGRRRIAGHFAASKIQYKRRHRRRSHSFRFKNKFGEGHQIQQGETTDLTKARH